MAVPRHEFYETDEKLILSVFDRGADPEAVSVQFEPRKFVYQNGDKNLSLEPLRGQIDPAKCDYTVGKVKIEIRLAKMVLGRWGGLLGDAPDLLAGFAAPPPPPSEPPISHKRKNWEGITTDILSSEKERNTEEDPNVGGDSSVNSFFQKIFADSDDDTKRAMMKSFQESGGTTLSTNWDEVRKGKVEVKPPSGSEWKNWATTKNGIGLNGTMPWHIPKDMAYFSRITSKTPTATQTNVVFMGRKTWESIPLKFRPLKKRINVVLSRNENYGLIPDNSLSTPTEPAYHYPDLETAVETFGPKNDVHHLFIIGGSSVYREALAQGPNHADFQADRILITRIHKPEFECDVFFPDVLGGKEWRQASHEEHSAWAGFEVPAGIQTENGTEFEFQMWVREESSA